MLVTWRLPGFCALAVGVAMTMGAARAAVADDLVLVEEGEPRAMIVVADDAAPIAEYAAEELVDHLERASGARLPIHAESDVPADSAMARVDVGVTAAARDAGAVPDAGSSEAFAVRIYTDRAFLVGREDGDADVDPLNPDHRTSGTLWAVYEVLEEHLGVRWLWPGEAGTSVPRHERITIPVQDEVIVPALVRRNVRSGYRWRNGELRPHPGTARRAQEVGLGFSQEGLARYSEDHFRFLRRHRMGRSDDARPYTGHRFSGWWQEYGEDHPEWFALDEEGRRGPEDDGTRHVSMCVSNPELHRYIIERWEQDRQENPDEAVAVVIGEADTRARCTCEDCRAWDAAQPTDEELAAMPNYVYWSHDPPFDAGQRYAKFAQEIHRLASEVDPDAIVTAFVYANYFVAPEDLELHPNIVMSFVPWPRWYFPRMPQEHQWVREQWQRWADTGATLYYRPNYTLDGYTMPHNYARQMADMFQTTLQAGSIGTDFDSLMGQWATQGPTLYVLMRLHWEPDASVETLLNEYYSAFGPASQAVRAYFEYWEAHSTAMRLDIYDIKDRLGANRLHTWARFAHEIYPPEAFDRAEVFLNRAEAIVEEAGPTEPGHLGWRPSLGDPEEPYAERIEFLRAGLEHARRCAEISALFADDDASEAERREALRELGQFRRSVEHLNIADYPRVGRIEFRSWEGAEELDLR